MPVKQQFDLVVAHLAAEAVHESFYMNRLKKTMLGALAGLAGVCGAKPFDLPDGKVEVMSDAELRITGVITPNVAEKFTALLSKDIRTISISSEGGVTEAALDMAEEIQRRKLDIKVIDICISSCANYLFVAGAKREVLPRAVVGWHGGHSFKPFRPSLDSAARLAEKEKLLLREQLLYARAGVSIELIVYSGLLTLGEQLDGVARREYSIWAPSADELRRLGIVNLSMEAGRRDSREVDKYLDELGFGGQSVYTGAAHSYLPAFLRKY